MFGAFLEKKYVVVGACIAFALLLVGAFSWWQGREASGPEPESFDSAYDVVVKTYDGTDVKLSKYKRKLLVVHAWASWCPYCGDEMKNLVALKQTYGDDVQILAINRAESLGEARAFTDALQISPDTLTLLLDPDDAFYKKIGGYAMPETIFVNSRGDIIYHQRGPMKVEEVTKQLEELMR